MLKVPGYELIEQLHSGIETLVYKGLRQNDQKPVILKILKQSFNDSRNSSRFKYEYSIARKFMDDIELADIDKTICIVMNDSSGTSLNHLMKNNVNLAPKEYIELAISIVKILRKIHDNHVIHKDLNPSNIVWNRSTGYIEIIDFGISSQLSRETPEYSSLNIVEGTLAYISPEQTGRMNRRVDYRSDYYSLGITLYELLTGAVPFRATDMISMVHCHLAVEPKPIDIQNQANWGGKNEKNALMVLSKIIMKLISKSSEERYQSSYGLLSDLEYCLSLIEDPTKTMNGYKIGTQDVSEKFQISQKLYGRQNEVEILNQAFNRVSLGSKELLLVKGYSGVGKSSLVNEVHRSIVKHNGYYVQGKFDQLDRNTPYTAIKIALSKLVKLILSETEESISIWKERFIKAVGSNGQIIVDLVPDLELLIGKQPRLQVLGLDETKNRFDTSIRSFVNALGNTVNPLVLFLDDLQWADTASLDLIKLIMSENTVEGLLIIGAYRDNEVDEMHPLTKTLSSIEEENTHLGNIHTILVKPLALEDVTLLIEDTLQVKNDQANDMNTLTALCYEKTKGNPFFINHLLETLHRDAIIDFNRKSGLWEWDADQLGSYNITDNVVELMLGKLRTLPKPAQELLQLAACVGSSFDLDALTVVVDTDIESKIKINVITQNLWTLLDCGLINPENSNYKYINTVEADRYHEIKFSFVHDRIQQAAYALIEAEDKGYAHLNIARLLYARSLVKNNNMLFDISNHYNKCIGLVKEKPELFRVLELNYKAGSRALSSGAYITALNYLKTSLLLMETDIWKNNYDLAIDLHLGTAKAAYYRFEFEEVDRLSQTVLEKAKYKYQKALMYEIVMKSLSSQEKLNQVLDMGVDVLKLLGLHIPARPNKVHIIKEFAITKWALRNKSIDELYELPLMEDTDAIAICRILAVMVHPAYVARADLSPIISLKLMQLSVKYGNYPNAQIYPYYGMMNLVILNDIDACYNFGELGLRLSEKDAFKESKAQNILMFYAFSHHLKKSLHESIDKFENGYIAGLENGDYEYASWSMHCPDYTAIYAGQALDDLSLKMKLHREKMIQLQQFTILNIYAPVHQSVSNLLGESLDPKILTGDYMNEAETFEKYDDGSVNTTIAAVYFWKSYLSYLFDDVQGAYENSKMIEKYEEAFAGLSGVPMIYFIASLSRLAYYDQAPPSERGSLVRGVRKSQKKLKKLADHAPMNNLHKWHLVEGELARVQGDHSKAIENYERAILLAKENRFLSEEAMAYELYAKFNLNNGNNEIGYFLMHQARLAYSKWGATAKLKLIDSVYALDDHVLFGDPATLSTSLSNTLKSNDTNTMSGRISLSIIDAQASLMVFQTISQEMKIEVLIEKIMKLVIQNAGAENGHLILENDYGWIVQASGFKDAKSSAEENVTINYYNDEHRIIESDESGLPISIVKFVLRSKNAVILMDAGDEGKFTSDPHIMRNKVKSVICMPLLNRNKLIGLLYLENNLMSDAFTSQQIQVLNMLSSQAAISLENARLYQSLEMKVDERTKELKSLNRRYMELSITDQLTGVFNRRKIDEVLNFEFDKTIKESKTLSIALLDIDKFKNINDTYGHLTGDKVLVQLARTVQSFRDKSYTFGRWGGEEFILICPNTPIDQAVEVAEKLRVHIAETEFEEVGHLTCSVGVSYTNGSTSVDTCLQEMDEALYKAKENGRNRVEHI